MQASISKTSVIALTPTFKTWRVLKNKSLGSKRAGVLRTGLTVGAYLEALSAKGYPAGLGTLQAAIKGEFVAIKSARSAAKNGSK